MSYTINGVEKEVDDYGYLLVPDFSEEAVHIIAAACVHLGATVSPRLFEGAWVASSHMDTHYDSTNPVRTVDGHLRVPEGPGLGVVPDEGVFGAPVASYA